MHKFIAATQFKAKCLRLISEVAEGGEPIMITKRGIPLAMLIPTPKNKSAGSALGALKGSV